MAKRNKKRKIRKRTPKSIAWDWLSRKIRLEAVVEFSQKHRTPMDEGGVECYTCGKILWVGDADAGHYKSRGVGGSSGLYFDERAIRVQCKQCNAFRQGRPEEFRKGLVKEYNEEIVKDLDKLHKFPSRWTAKDYPMMARSYKQDVIELLNTTGIEPWNKQFKKDLE